MELIQKIKENIRDVENFPKEGIIFKDITPLFYDQNLINQTVNFIKDELINDKIKIDAVVGIESRGFIIGSLLANVLNVPFVLIRKSGKLPRKTIRHEYNLEYGVDAVEIHEDSIKTGWNVLIHDDLLATGGTAAAAAELIQKLNAKIAAFNFIVELNFLNGRNILKKYSNKTICPVQF